MQQCTTKVCVENNQHICFKRQQNLVETSFADKSAKNNIIAAIIIEEHSNSNI